MENYPKPVTKESHKQIMDYLDNSIYQIKGCKEKVGIGFFCSLRCRDKKIYDYLDNSIYQIKGSDDKYGIGFFCLLKCHDKTINVLITNYQIVNENYLQNNDYIEVFIHQKLIRIEFNLLY